MTDAPLRPLAWLAQGSAGAEAAGAEAAGAEAAGADADGAAAWGPERGRWGPPEQLGIPLDDRGLLLADGLFETVLVEGGQPQLLAEHLQRWRRSAALLGMAPPPALAAVRALAAAAVERSGIGTGALRLNWSRGDGGWGSGGRGIDLPAGPGAAAAPGRFWLQLTPCRPCFEPLAVIVSPSERRCATSVLSRCKTFAYGPAIQARRQARAAGVDDALLESTAGGLCCGTTANLLLQLEGRWLTPALASGCLPGVMRGRALALGLVEESPQPLGLDVVQGGEVQRGEVGGGEVQAAWLLNSLGCRPIHTINGYSLTRASGSPADLGASQAAERFWRRLLQSP